MKTAISSMLMKLKQNFKADVYFIVVFMVFFFGFLGEYSIKLYDIFKGFVVYLFRIRRILRFTKKVVVVLMLGAFSIVIFTPISTYATYSNDLSSKNSIIHNNDTGVLLLDRNGKPFFKLYKTKYKQYVPLSNIPVSVQEALVAGEDKDFYRHSGFSLKGILRSLISDLQAGNLDQGGSTLTQQLVKNSLLSPKRNFYRKFQELLLAQEIESRYSKKEILEMYLNTVYFGNDSYGIEEASQTYFGKHASQLSLAESSFLVSLLPAPSKLSPYDGGYKLAKDRQRYILTQMLSDGYVSKSQADHAYNEKLVFNQNDNFAYYAPHFALMVRDELVKKYGEAVVENSGFTVRTTLDLSLQNYSEKAVSEQVQNLRGNIVSNGGAVVIDPKSGEILALVGSHNWDDPNYGKLNIVTAKRQTGSAFKPIVYVTAFENHVITPATILKDQPTTFPGGYAPLDYDKRWRGNVTARRALANSLNVPSVQVLQMVGVPAVVDNARALGISEFDKEPSNYGLTIVLGTQEISLLELTNAYATFANQGEKNDTTTILGIQDKKGNVIYKHEARSQKAIDPEYTYLISSILSDSKTRAEVFGNLLDISKTSAVKTGTSENYRDSLTVGYTPSVAIGVWVGNNDGTPMDTVAGSLGAAPIWKSIMEHYLAGKPDEGFVEPPGVVSGYICPWNGLMMRAPSSAGYKEYFAQGTEPMGYCNSAQPPASTPSASFIRSHD